MNTAAGIRRSVGLGRLSCEIDESLGHRRIVLVDSQPVYRGAIRNYLESVGCTVVAEVETGGEAVGIVQEHACDMIIVDLDVTGGGASSLLQQLMRARRNVRILILSALSEEHYAERSLTAGARGFLSKNVKAEEIIDAVLRIFDGELVFSRDVVERVVRRRDLAARRAVEEYEGLSQREFQIFRLLAEGITCREVSERIGLSVKTVQTYCDRIKIKKGYRSQQHLVAAAAQWLQRPGH